MQSRDARTLFSRSLALVLIPLFAAACGGGDDSDRATAGAGDETATDARMQEPTSSTEVPPANPPNLAEWHRIEVTDASGETFAIGDLVGRPVLVENFATWCSNCRRQLGDTQEAAARAGEEAVFVALSVETEVDSDDLQDYAAKNKFSDIRFAVMSPELLAVMHDAYGNSSLNPPSTPKVKVAADGTPGELVTGYESADEILAGLGLL